MGTDKKAPQNVCPLQQKEKERDSLQDSTPAKHHRKACGPHPTHANKGQVVILGFQPNDAVMRHFNTPIKVVSEKVK